MYLQRKTKLIVVCHILHDSTVEKNIHPIYYIYFYFSAHVRQTALLNIQKALKSRIINGFLSDR